MTSDELKEILSYDASTGIFRRKVGLFPNREAGDIAGSTCEGFVCIKIQNKTYKTHRLAWLYVYGKWPAKQLDHMNGVRNDNRISNLREVTNSENNQNQSRARSDNGTGLLGVSRGRPGMYVAFLGIGGKRLYLGSFSDPHAAHAAYLEAKRVMHPAGML